MAFGSLHQADHMHFSVFFNYDKDEFTKFKRSLNVQNSQKFIRKFSALADLFAEQFNILGCDQKDSLEDIRSSYLKLAKIYHPDRHANKSENIKEDYRLKFEKIQNAYESLKGYFKEQELAAHVG